MTLKSQPFINLLKYIHILSMVMIGHLVLEIGQKGYFPPILTIFPSGYYRKRPSEKNPIVKIWFMAHFLKQSLNGHLSPKNGVSHYI